MYTLRQEEYKRPTQVQLHPKIKERVENNVISKF